MFKQARPHDSSFWTIRGLTDRPFQANAALLRPRRATSINADSTGKTPTPNLISDLQRRFSQDDEAEPAESRPQTIAARSAF
jgi:hypothetical protein